MTRVNPDELKAIASGLFAPRIAEDLGRWGSVTLQSMLRSLRAIHRAISTERLSRGLTVVALEEDGARLLMSPPATISQYRHLTTFHSGGDPLSIQVRPDGSFHAWAEAVSLDNIEGKFLAYRFDGPRNEYFVTPIAEHSVPELSAAPSYFGVPYFRELQDALVDYGQSLARKSQCPVLARTWRDEKRLMFRPKPEADMRRSLESYLRASLRDYSEIVIMPEQNVNESRPVDIKVVWSGENRVALVEIKWLGMSHGEGPEAKTVTFSASRARDGAMQLADYLDLYAREATHEETRGYLAVFDARRRRIKPTSVSLSSADGMHFRSNEIDYPQIVLDRFDFAPPVRMFCEPVVESVDTST